jgi:hypothetical protein
MLEESPAGNNAITKIKVKCIESNDEYTLQGRPCEFSAFSFVPPNRRNETVDRSIYNFKSEKRVYTSNYDQLFDINYGYDGKVHRCDRRNAKNHGLNVWKEELQKDVPSRSSSEYGHRLIRTQNGNIAAQKAIIEAEKYMGPIDPNDRKHVRIMTVKSEFYNRNGLNDLVQSENTLYQ